MTLLHQDINYTLGRLSQEALELHAAARAGRSCLLLGRARGLAQQRLRNAIAGAVLRPADGLYAGRPRAALQRGQRRAACTTGAAAGSRWTANTAAASRRPSARHDTPGYCKETPHTIFNVEKGIAIAPKTALTFNIQNLLNDRYYVTLLNAQGNHYAPPRTFSMGIRFSP